MEIIQCLIPKSNTYTRPGIKMVPKSITIHETDNPNVKADANAHAMLQYNGNSRQASWHLQIDDKLAIQSIPFNEVAWAAGDGSGPGNMSSIHIEICVNSDGDYKKAVANAAEVTRQLISEFNISIANVVQHNHWSGKNCPSTMRSGKSGITWADFLNMLKEEKKPAVKVAESTAIMWDGMELKPGQRGRVTILQLTILWKRTGNKLEKSRDLKVGEVYRVYSYDDQFGGQYGVGNGYYVTALKDTVKYETPSKAMLARVNK